MALELSTRLKDQSSIVRELADKAEDTVWARLKKYTFILAFAASVLAFFGLKPLYEIYAEIKPKVDAAEQRIQAATQTITRISAEITPLKAAVDRLSEDVDAQTKRVSEKGGEISHKFQSLDATATTFSSRLESMERASENKLKQVSQQLTQVSRQAEIVSVRQAYPTLGQTKYVTLNGLPWKGKSAKKADDIWINLNIGAYYIGDFSPDQIDNFVDTLKKAGYNLFPGSFGFGGPVVGGYGPLGVGNPVKPTVFYFNNDRLKTAQKVAALTSEALSMKDVDIMYLDISSVSKEERFVIEQSGLDLQIYLVIPQQ